MYAANVGGSWRWRRHPASMTAAHTTRYDLQAGMVALLHSILTARIMAGASAQWYGIRTAELLLISGRYY